MGQKNKLILFATFGAENFSSALLRRYRKKYNIDGKYKEKCIKSTFSGVLLSGYNFSFFFFHSFLFFSPFYFILWLLCFFFSCGMDDARIFFHTGPVNLFGRAREKSLGFKWGGRREAKEVREKRHKHFSLDFYNGTDWAFNFRFVFSYFSLALKREGGGIEKKFSFFHFF